MELFVYEKDPPRLNLAQVFMAEALSIALSLDTPIYDALFKSESQ